MRFWAIVILILSPLCYFAGLGIYLNANPQVVYKCPKGQVAVREDAGTETEAIRCYTPGVRYYDMRPETTKRIDHWKEKKEN